MRSLAFAVVLVACGNNVPPAATAPSETSSTATTPPLSTTAPPTSTPTATTPPAPSAIAPSTPEADAQRAAETWLGDVDAARYADSWTNAASLFRAAVDQPTWTKAVSSVRGPLGALKSRALRSAKYTKTAPGAPDGEYVILQFDAVFEKKQHAVETVTPMKDNDGRWRVSGYFIK